ncbi:CLAVATA3/ESR (CLE)-related protein 10, partial [Cucurbita argyrosperma subsp. sororia]
MKASLSPSSSFATNGQLIMMILIVLFLFVSSSTATRLSNHPPSTTVPEASPITPRHHPPRHKQQLHPCDALTRENSRSLCIHLHRVYQHRLPVYLPPLPLPLLTHNQIDPRYGVEKRLVPSGPNPLHN